MGLFDALRAPEYRTPWIASGVLHLCAVVFSVGFYHPDEHFQTLEWVYFKIHGLDPSYLAWEYEARIRPWLQPGIYYAIIEPLSSVGVNDPFVFAFLARLFGAVLGWLSLPMLATASFQWIEETRWRKWVVFALALLWIFPHLHARTSSENLSTTFFFMGLSILVLGLESRNHVLSAGILFGLAFEARYQVGVMILGAGLWLLYQRRWRTFALLIPGVLLAVALGTVIDAWGYGEWTFAPWNYFEANLIKDEASRFGVSPPWFYAIAVLEKVPLPVNLAFALLVPWAWVRHRQHLLTWAMVPFLLVHLLIGHKELRFLYPLVPAAVILLVLWARDYEARIDALWARLRAGWRRKLVVALLLLPNFAYLAVATIKPMRGDYYVFKRLHARYPDRLDLYTLRLNPYRLGEKLGYRFFAPPEVNVTLVKSFEEFEAIAAGADHPTTLILRKREPPAALVARCEVIYRTFPQWMEHFNVNDWLSRTYNATVIECPARSTP